jgi:hypothetical protein
MPSSLAIYADLKSVEAGYSICGDFQISLLSESGADIDIANITFLSYEN